MLASFPAVANKLPPLEKSIVLIVLFYSLIENNFFIDGTCQYSNPPSESAVTNVLKVVLTIGLHLREVTEF